MGSEMCIRDRSGESQPSGSPFELIKRILHQVVRSAWTSRPDGVEPSHHLPFGIQQCEVDIALPGLGLVRRGTEFLFPDMPYWLGNVRVIAMTRPRRDQERPQLGNNTRMAQRGPTDLGRGGSAVAGGEVAVLGMYNHQANGATFASRTFASRF